MHDFLQALKQPEYVHVLLNHLPITGLAVAILALVIGLIIRRPATIWVGLGLVVLLSLSVWPVYAYGQAAYDRVLAMSDDAGGAYLKYHRYLAERWVWLYYVTAGAGVAAMFVGWRWPRWLTLASLVVVLLAIASLAAGSVIADYGGKVRHREFRMGTPPTVPNGVSRVAPDPERPWPTGVHSQFPRMSLG